MVRWFWFILSILVGAALGALYMWYINPAEGVHAAPSSLRIDYKTDYVLMVAEAYSAEQDLPLAVSRLSLLADAPPAETVDEALEFAEAHYQEGDIALLQALSAAVQTWNPALNTEAP